VENKPVLIGTEVTDGLRELRKIINVLVVSEEKNKQIEHRLATSEVRYRRLFETAQDGILIIHAGSEKIIDVNPFLSEMLGYTKEHFIGKRLWEIVSLKTSLPVSKLSGSYRPRGISAMKTCRWRLKMARPWMWSS